MSQQNMQVVVVHLGEGLYFLQHALLGTLRSIERKGKIVTLGFVDGSTQELSEAQSRKFLEDFGIEKPLVQPVAMMPAPPRAQ
jgi:hypothetical protein